VVDAQSPPRTATLGYDAVNQLTGVAYSDGATPNVSNLTYDADGQRLTMTDGTGTSSWVWDSLHRLTSSTDGVPLGSAEFGWCRTSSSSSGDIAVAQIAAASTGQAVANRSRGETPAVRSEKPWPRLRIRAWP